jgi:hypothetical protein
MTARQQRDDFDGLWRQMVREGDLDDLGSAEYNRCRGLYDALDEKPKDLEQFIRTKTNLIDDDPEFLECLSNRTHAARLLEISHRALLYKIKELRIRD